MPALERILVFRTSDEPCSTSSCDQIIAALSHSFPSAKVQLASGIRQDLSGNPALIVVQSRGADERARSTRQLGPGMRHAPVLAVMCGMHQAEEMPLHVLRSLDDYICC